MSKQKRKKADTPYNIISRMKNDGDIGPKFELVVAFIKRLAIQDFSGNLRSVFFGHEATALALKMKLAKTKEKAVEMLQKLFKFALFEDVSKVQRFKNEKVFYRLRIPQRAIEVYIQSFHLRNDLKEVRDRFSTKLRDDIFRRMLHDVVLLCIERQANLEEILQNERKEYKSLYLKYSELKKQSNDYYANKIQELEKDLEMSKRTNSEYKINLDNIRKKVEDSGGSVDDVVHSRVTSREVDHQMDEYNRLKDDIVRLENENETLTKHNEVLIKKFDEAKRQTGKFQKSLEQTKKESFELKEKLKKVTQKYQEVIQKGAVQNEKLIDVMNKKVEVEKKEREDNMDQIDQLENQLKSVHQKLLKVQVKIGSGGSGDQQMVVNQAAGNINQKLSEIIEEISKK